MSESLDSHGTGQPVRPSFYAPGKGNVLGLFSSWFGNQQESEQQAAIGPEKPPRMEDGPNFEAPQSVQSFVQKAEGMLQSMESRHSLTSNGSKRVLDSIKEKENVPKESENSFTVSRPGPGHAPRQGEIKKSFSVPSQAMQTSAVAVGSGREAADQASREAKLQAFKAKKAAGRVPKGSLGSTSRAVPPASRVSRAPSVTSACQKQRPGTDAPSEVRARVNFRPSEAFKAQQEAAKDREGDKEADKKMFIMQFSPPRRQKEEAVAQGPPKKMFSLSFSPPRRNGKERGNGERRDSKEPGPEEEHPGENQREEEEEERRHQESRQVALEDRDGLGAGPQRVRSKWSNGTSQPIVLDLPSTPSISSSSPHSPPLLPTPLSSASLPSSPPLVAGGPQQLGETHATESHDDPLQKTKEELAKALGQLIEAEENAESLATCLSESREEVSLLNLQLKESNDKVDDLLHTVLELQREREERDGLRLKEREEEREMIESLKMRAEEDVLRAQFAIEKELLEADKRQKDAARMVTLAEEKVRYLSLQVKEREAHILNLDRAMQESSAKTAAVLQELYEEKSRRENEREISEQMVQKKRELQQDVVVQLRQQIEALTQERDSLKEAVRTSQVAERERERAEREKESVLKRKEAELQEGHAMIKDLTSRLCASEREVGVLTEKLTLTEAQARAGNEAARDVLQLRETLERKEREEDRRKQEKEAEEARRRMEDDSRRKEHKELNAELIKQAGLIQDLMREKDSHLKAVSELNSELSETRAREQQLLTLSRRLELSLSSNREEVSAALERSKESNVKVERLEKELQAARERHQLMVQQLQEEMGQRSAGLEARVAELALVKEEKANAATALLDKELVIADLQAKILRLETVRRKLHNKVMELKGNIRVFVRLRPTLPHESNGEKLSYDANTKEYALFSFPDKHYEAREIELFDIPTEHVSRRLERSRKWAFAFDRVFGPSASQEELFTEVSALVQSAIDGYRVCIFAYGQTGSGKTYTMQGDIAAGTLNNPSLGVIGRSVQHIFASMAAEAENGWSTVVTVEILEIYNEQINDLLAESPKPRPEIKLDYKGDPTVVGVERRPVSTEQDVFALLSIANLRRATKKTKVNDKSSRSHLVFTLRIEMTNSHTSVQRSGLVHLVDLAGSERLSVSGSSSDAVMLKEAQSINKSLSTLGTVIQAIANKEKHVPFRDSKLTYLLQPALGGDCKTLMICNLSPVIDNRHESLCSLRFAKKVNSCEMTLSSTVGPVA